MNAQCSVVELATNALIPNSVPLPWNEPVSFLLAVQFAPGSFQLHPEPTYGHFSLGNLQHNKISINPQACIQNGVGVDKFATLRIRNLYVSY